MNPFKPSYDHLIGAQKRKLKSQQEISGAILLKILSFLTVFCLQYIFTSQQDGIDKYVCSNSFENIHNVLLKFQTKIASALRKGEQIWKKLRISQLKLLLAIRKVFECTGKSKLFQCHYSHENGLLPCYPNTPDSLNKQF